MTTQSTSWQRPSTHNLRENPERLAWLVLLGSFAIFCVLAITIPAAFIYTVRYASTPQTARLDPTLGTLFFYPDGKGEPIAVTNVRENIAEGARIVAADDSTQATLSLNSDPVTGEALGSMQIYSGVDLTLLRLRRPLFGRSPEPYHTLLRLDAGQARLFTSSASERPIDVELETPHGLIALAPGSYQISVSPEETVLTVRNGQATLEHPQQPALVVSDGQLAWMSPTDISDEAAPAGQNLIENSTFSPPVLDVWQSYQTAEASTTPGKVQFNESEDGRRVAQFLRMGEEKLHTEVGITQAVEQAVNVYDDLRLQLDVKILFQSLPGAGSLNSEFPLRIEVSYRDVYGKDLTWGHGFYYRDPEPGEAYPPVVNGTKVRQGQWYTYLSPNLISLLDSQGTRPAYINSIRIYASGHNYQSMVGEVYVLAE
jgi:hypothetical protein